MSIPKRPSTSPDQNSLRHLLKGAETYHLAKALWSSLFKRVRQNTCWEVHKSRWKLQKLFHCNNCHKGCATKFEVMGTEVFVRDVSWVFLKIILFNPNSKALSDFHSLIFIIFFFTNDNYYPPPPPFFHHYYFLSLTRAVPTIVPVCI